MDVSLLECPTITFIMVYATCLRYYPMVAVTFKQNVQARLLCGLRIQLEPDIQCNMLGSNQA